MIPRYSRAKMANLWTSEAKYSTWLKVELAHCEALVDAGLVPKQAFEIIREKAKFETSRVDEIEKTVKHDVIAFLTNVSEHVGPEARHLHYGLTSSDLLDSSFALQLKEAGELILEGLEGVRGVLKEQAVRHKDLVSVGRSHGIHAEPTSFGLKFTLWYAEATRNMERLKRAIENISYGKFSGAVGNFSFLTPEIEAKICATLGLKPAPVSTQVIQRDRHAEYFSTLAIIAGLIEKISIEIRHLQRTEVMEVEESFSKGQKGSSAMPHKKNPILSENLTGLARLLRSHASAALENIALWHERDISHSSVERVIAPDATILMDFMLARVTTLLKNLVVHRERVQENLERSFGLVYSQRVLLALTQKGVSRENSYEWVQRNAMMAWEQKKPFMDFLLNDKDVGEALTESEVRDAFDPNHYLTHVDTIYERVFNV